MKSRIVRLFCAAFLAVVASSCTVDEDRIVGEWDVLEYMCSRLSSDVSSLSGATSMSAGKGQNEVFIFDGDRTGSVSGVGKVETDPETGQGKYVEEPWSLPFNWSLDGKTLTLDYISGEPFLGGTKYEVQISPSFSARMRAALATILSHGLVW